MQTSTIVLSILALGTALAPPLFGACWNIVALNNDMPYPCLPADLGTPCNDCTADPLDTIIPGTACAAPASFPSLGRNHICMIGIITLTVLPNGQQMCVCFHPPNIPPLFYGVPIFCTQPCNASDPSEPGE
ncbi:MAG: hypothetical protein SH859_03085 [Hyphomicrobium aestuarii]|nr:hypothetical protein [Hyphomicrobium aestuarii]